MDVTRLDWDSNFFGFNVAKIKGSSINENQLKNVLEYCRLNEISLLQFKSNLYQKKNINLAEKYKFNFVDLRITYLKKISQIKGKIFKIKLANEKDIPELKNICNNLFKYSRYYYDSNFDKTLINNFYKNWIEKSVIGNFDHGVYVYKEFKKIMGFLSFRKNKSFGEISLIGTAKKYQRIGVAHELLKFFEHQLLKSKINKIKVTTQGRNISAQNFYQKNDFLTQKLEAYYHLWII